MDVLRRTFVHTAEVGAIADRPNERKRRDAELALDLVEQVERLSPRPVHLVDEREDRKPPEPGYLVEFSRLRLDAVRRVDEHHDAICGGERPVGVFAEVLVAGRVEQVDDVVLVIELQDRRRDRDTALLLDLHPVRSRMTFVPARRDGPGQSDGSAIQEQLFGQGRLACVGMRDDRKGPPSPDLVLECVVHRFSPGSPVATDGSEEPRPPATKRPRVRGAPVPVNRTDRQRVALCIGTIKNWNFSACTSV